MIDPRFTNAIEDLHYAMVHLERRAKIINDAMALEGRADRELRDAQLDFEMTTYYLAQALDYTGAILKREERIP